MMITALIHVTVKPGREDEFQKTFSKWVVSTRAEDEGCVNFVFLKKETDPRKFVLFEQWADQGSLNSHLARARTFFGDPSPGGGQLPAVLVDFFDEFQSETFELIA